MSVVIDKLLSVDFIDELYPRYRYNLYDILSSLFEECSYQAMRNNISDEDRDCIKSYFKRLSKEKMYDIFVSIIVNITDYNYDYEFHQLIKDLEFKTCEPFESSNRPLRTVRRYGNSTVSKTRYDEIISECDLPTTEEERKELKKLAFKATFANHSFLLEFKGVNFYRTGTVSMHETGMFSLHEALHQMNSSLIQSVKLYWIRSICKALEYLHALGIVQGRINSHSIMICLSTDFRLVPKLKVFTNYTNVKEKLVYQTRYLPDNLSSDSFKNDVYAIGVLINEILTRQRPFDQYTRLEELHKALERKERPRLHETENYLEQNIMVNIVGDIHNKCFAENPNRRPTVKQMLESI